MELVSITPVPTDRRTLHENFVTFVTQNRVTASSTMPAIRALAIFAWSLNFENDEPISAGVYAGGHGLMRALQQ